MYNVYKNGKEIGSGTLTECIEFIAGQMNQFHPEQVTVFESVFAGYRMLKA